MDPAFRELMDSAPGKNSGQKSVEEIEIALVGAGLGEVEIALPDGPRRYIMKPLLELFSPDRPPPGEGWDHDDRIMGLLRQIEESIVRFFGDIDPDLADSHVALILSRLAMKPGCDPGGDALCLYLQSRLRLCLSLNDYSRQEVRWALNKIERSVQLHRKLDGPQGYLTFITEQLGG